MEELNGKYCLATKEHYNKLVEDGCKLLGPHECITPKEQAYFYHVSYGYITYCTKEYYLNDIVPMHLHNNSWVFGSLEHEEELAIACAKCGAVLEDHYIDNGGYPYCEEPKPVVERIPKEEAIGELRQWAEKQRGWIDFHEFSGVLDIYIEETQKENS